MSSEKSFQPKRFVAWISEVNYQASRLRPPVALFTAASWEHVNAFAENNPELFRAPLLVFSFGRKDGTPYQEPAPDGLGLHALQCHDFTVPSEPVEVGVDLPHYFESSGMPNPRDAALARMEWTVGVACWVARKLGGPVWEIYAEQSEGLLTAGIARAQSGSAVALSKYPPSLPLLGEVNRNAWHLTQKHSDTHHFVPELGRG